MAKNMAQDSDSRSLDKVIVRLPDGMRDRIKAAAERNNRSMNAEIVAVLEEKYPALDALTFGRMVDLLETVIALGRHPDPAKQGTYTESVDALVAEFQRRFPEGAPGVLAQLGYKP